jgi:hypothetical protein
VTGEESATADYGDTAILKEGDAFYFLHIDDPYLSIPDVCRVDSVTEMETNEAEDVDLEDVEDDEDEEEDEEEPEEVEEIDIPN